MHCVQFRQWQESGKSLHPSTHNILRSIGSVSGQCLHRSWWYLSAQYQLLRWFLPGQGPIKAHFFNLTFKGLHLLFKCCELYSSQQREHENNVTTSGARKKP